MNRMISVSFISSYLPRQCGIATFTNDLATSLTRVMDVNLYDGNAVQVMAVNNVQEGYKYSSEVKFEIKEQDIDEYKEAAYYLNLSQSEVISLQHEFGLYGGESGSNIISLIQNLKKPLVTTLHTVLNTPNQQQLKIMKEIGNYSSYVIVQSKRAIKVLEKIYKIPSAKIIYIPHGAPDVPFLDTAYYKDKFSLSDRKVILTFGLLGPGKGIEDVITAMKDVVKKFPLTTYIVLGATHPNVIKQYGEEYRDTLENLVKKYSLEGNVMFINRFVDYDRLLEFLLMSDIYISPYQNREQMVSGTLTYAVACGKAVVSTPYWYAEELLDNNTGNLVPFKDSEAISKTLKHLLSDETARNRLRKNAYDKGRAMVWNRVALDYFNVFGRAVDEFKYKRTTRIHAIREKILNFPSLPDVNLNHLINLTDSTGILQHASYAIANRNEGYCTDDNARALHVAVMNKNMFNNDSALSLINTYMSFLLHAFNPVAGQFRNFMNFERKWLEDTGSDECNGRVLFTLGYIIKNPPSDSYFRISKDLFDRAIGNTHTFTSPRAWAYIIMGCIFYLSRFSGAREVKRICKTFSEKLSHLYEENTDEKWRWFEQEVCYNNAIMPQALIMAGRFFKNKDYISQGVESLIWLFDIQYDKEKKHISLVGNDGWYPRGKTKAKYDQQPLEIPALIDACIQAYLAKEDKEWITKIGILYSWFLGNNVRSEPLYDYITGGCFDGLSSSVTNQNQGAESTICWLHTLHRMNRLNQNLHILSVKA